MKPPSVATSSRYPVAPVDAFQLAEKLVGWMFVAAVATGAAGAVVRLMVFEFPLVPFPLYALTR